MIKIGICGYGTVGQSLVKHLIDYKDLITAKLSSEFEIILIADRSIKEKSYPKNINISTNIMDVCESGKIDILVELIGNEEVTYPLIKKAIDNKISIVTANKALIANHGHEIFALASQNNVFMGFEASVAGAIPIVKTLKQSKTNEDLHSIHGIINGTCNYILHRMSSGNLDFNDALDEAKKLGYAEADPTFDINGMDAAHKISILASIAYGKQLPINDIFIEGIENITTMDIRYANELGYTIKHVGITGFLNNMFECRVHPVLISEKNILSQVSGVMNAIILKGDKFGTSMLYGHGAGGPATASAVVSDIIESASFIKNDNKFNLNSFSHDNKNIKTTNINKVECPFYLRISADDVSGVMAEITNILANESISIEAVTQHEPNNDNTTIPIVMITNSVKGELIHNAINKMEKLDHVRGKVHFIRVLKSDE